MLFLGASIAGEATKSAALMAYVSRPSKFTVHIKVVLCIVNYHQLSVQLCVLEKAPTTAVGLVLEPRLCPSTRRTLLCYIF